jgi:LPS export ABC transporter protein LptC
MSSQTGDRRPVLCWHNVIPMLLVPALGALFFTFQRMEGTSVEPPAGPAAPPRYTLAIADLTRYDTSGEPTLTAQAQRIDYFDDASGRAFDLQVDLLSLVGGGPWHLSAPAATLPAHQRKFLLEGPVNANGRWPDTGEPVKVRTERLWVDPDARAIQTDATVTVDSATRTGTGVGMRADWAGRTLDLLHDVTINYDTTD